MLLCSPGSHGCHLSTSWSGSKINVHWADSYSPRQCDKLCCVCQTLQSKDCEMPLKPWKPGEWRGESDSCGNAITFNKKRKLNTQKERPSVKKKTSRPITVNAPMVILQKQAYAELLLDRDFKKFAWLPAKVIKLLKLIWANQAVSGRLWSQVDLRTAFTEPEVEQFCSFSPHQSKGTWEETWERGWWWGWVGRGSGRGEIVPVVTIKENEGNRVRQGSDQVRLAT